jgi:hypothetical protein
VVAHASTTDSEAPPVAPSVAVNHTSRPSAAGRIFRGLVLLILGVVAGAAAAHYGKDFYQKRMAAQPPPEATASPSPVQVTEDPALTFEKRRREVDRSPSEWLASGMQAEMAKQNIQRPQDSTDPEFLYLYGRALLLTGDQEGAIGAFEQATQKLEASNPGGRTPLQVDARLARAAAALKTERLQVMQPAIISLNEVMEKKKEGAAPTASPSSPPSPSP